MKLKNSLFVLLIALSFQITLAQETPKSAAQILKNDLQKATIENKNVFIIFKASWCGWCKKMEANINNKTINKYFTDNYVISYITVLESEKNKNLENPGAEDLLNKYGGKNQGIPFYLIFDSKANLLVDSKMIAGEEILKGEGINIGCPSTDDEIDAFIYKLQKTSNLTAEQLKAIAIQFKQNN
ncbi:thioredoxin family protein [Lutibacter sp. HS1-25]|uniref:thioredoxin family protein n=1 Tax=Lutibacter sp. HS1-25 TaxID=2485000 RepID=UPI001012A6AD|nr:thioredoxin family protein [Lutibacter sp. HS1-25]RXP52289.1 thioredoxin family protein [Lutibacter sp. HS1-25]